MHRFFIPAQGIQGERVTIEGSQVHQIRDVLRLDVGDHIVCLDDSGWEYEVELSAVAGMRAEGVVCRKGLVDAEPATRIVLYQALLKGSSFELALQKCTELGVAGFVPLLCERCVAGHLRDVTGGKMERWQRIVTEAAEQSRRGRLPTLEPVVFFQQACQQVQGLSIMPWEEEREARLRDALKEVRPRAKRSAQRKPAAINVFVGPEGGFSPPEVELARTSGIAVVSLGPRVLRAETAAMAVVAAVLYELGDLDPLPATDYQMSLSLH
ncbi:MAG: RsmE family RNA methyltransferase [Chloroflexota bacterium]|nr:RsmE family RNA methyltransferase [Chloroflexota bacterium]